MPNILAPDGEVYDIPPDKVSDALSGGGKAVSRVQAPGGTIHWIPDDQLGEAQKAGGLVIPSVQKPDIAGNVQRQYREDTKAGPFTKPGAAEAATDVGLEPIQNAAAATAGGVVGAPAGAAAVEAVPGALAAIKTAAQSHPFIAKILARALETGIVGEIIHHELKRK